MRRGGGEGAAIGAGLAAAFLVLFPAFRAAAADVPGPEPAARRYTLEEAINRALAANRGLAGAADRVEGEAHALAAAASEFELKISPAATLGAAGGDDDASEPAYAVGVALGRRFASGTSFSVEPTLRRDGDEHRAALDTRLLQPLLRGRGEDVTLAPVRDAEFSGRAARRAHHAQRVATVLETVAAVYAVVREREVLRVSEDSAASLRGHAEAARVKERVGVADPIDVYRAEIQLKSAEDALATARESHRNALDDLKLVLALPLEAPVEVEAPLVYEAAAITEEDAAAAALRNRVELEQADDTVRDTERLAALAEHRVLPELNLALSYARFGEGGAAESLGLDRGAWGVNLETSTTLGRTAEKAAHAQSLIGVRAARRARELARDDLARGAKRELRTLRREEQRIAIEQERIRQAQGQLELARVQLRHGLANNFDVIDAEAALRAARTSLLGAVAEHVVGTWRLRGAMGTLVQRPERF